MALGLWVGWWTTCRLGWCQTCGLDGGGSFGWDGVGHAGWLVQDVWVGWRRTCRLGQPCCCSSGSAQVIGAGLGAPVLCCDLSGPGDLSCSCCPQGHHTEAGFGHVSPRGNVSPTPRPRGLSLGPPGLITFSPDRGRVPTAFRENRDPAIVQCL